MHCVVPRHPFSPQPHDTHPTVKQTSCLLSAWIVPECAAHVCVLSNLSFYCHGGRGHTNLALKAPAGGALQSLYDHLQLWCPPLSLPPPVSCSGQRVRQCCFASIRELHVLIIKSSSSLLDYSGEEHAIYPSFIWTLNRQRVDALQLQARQKKGVERLILAKLLLLTNRIQQCLGKISSRRLLNFWSENPSKLGVSWMDVALARQASCTKWVVEERPKDSLMKTWSVLSSWTTYPRSRKRITSVLRTDLESQNKTWHVLLFFFIHIALDNINIFMGFLAIM